MKLLATSTVLGLIMSLVLSCRDAEPPAVSPADKAAVVKGDNEFALDLYAQLRTQQGNLFFSPSSISTALAMTYAGARGATADEMAKTLHFTLDQERLHPAMAALVRELNGGGKPRGYQLSIANALWGQKGYPFKEDFLKLNRENYGAGLSEVDFQKATEEARQTINAWVEKHTQDKIKELLKPGVLDPMTRMVLTNAIYFKGDWARQFPKKRTHDGDFHVTDKDKVTVPLMSQEGEFKYLKGTGFQALELPYNSPDLSMVVFLPDKVDGLSEFEKSLTAGKVAEWIGKLKPTPELSVILPKFKMTTEFMLKDVLMALGMKQAFEPGKADFTGMSPSRELYISAVVHKAFVDVNEEGTEAAAATAVVVKATSARITPVFRADHPFLFLIRDNRTGSILFLGRVSNPGS